jgi:hypothetical protein
LAFIVTLQVGNVPVYAPDHWLKVELASGVAVKFTTVPAMKFVPPGVVMTPPVPVPALFTVRVYCEAPAWVMLKVFPAMVKVPVLELELVLVSTEKVVLPFPLPLLPKLILIQLRVLEAPQEQPPWAVMLTVPVPPPESKD